jgi:Tfp pilus assembly protein PilF
LSLDFGGIAMGSRTTLVFLTLFTGSLFLPSSLYSQQKLPTPGLEATPTKTSGLITLVVRDTAGGSVTTPRVQLYGEAQDGTQYQGSPTSRGDEWDFVVPGVGTYTAEVSAPGFKTTTKIISVTETTGHPYYDVRLEPDAQPGKVRGNTIMAPKARAELEKGKAALEQKQFEEARLHLDKTLHLAPTSPEANYYSGLLFYYTGDRKAAMARLEKAVSLDRDSGPYFLALGEVYYVEKQYPQAASMLEQGLALQPDSWRAEAVLGSAYSKQSDYPRCAEHAQRSLTIGKDEASGTNFLLGKCLAALGKKAEAVAALQSFLAVQPVSDLSTSAQVMLKHLQANP